MEFHFWILVNSIDWMSDWNSHELLVSLIFPDQLFKAWYSKLEFVLEEESGTFTIYHIDQFDRKILVQTMIHEMNQSSQIVKTEKNSDMMFMTWRNDSNARELRQIADNELATGVVN